MQDENEAVEQTQTEEENVPVSNAGLTMETPEAEDADDDPIEGDMDASMFASDDEPEAENIEAPGAEDDEIRIQILDLPANGMPLRVNGKMLCKCLRVGDTPTLSSAGVLALSNIDGVDFEYI